ncbi:MgtC/SapB family protein [Zobellia amurskyensis]|uniref:MgtC/SapB family protein n=1 Tax=Zobellia amurskyensis TaxID=248905 RepID=A0A7X2ZQM3_9FLAO|nr:MgtC/SapB family protein [Zobellia amurskyensis]MUH34600.1 MgtC/SapB family protein [Zobellia amurskyensis]MUH41484.1 MgtC/SapB family protein [Zobellia laminariae]
MILLARVNHLLVRVQKDFSEIGIEPDWTFHSEFLFKILLAILAGFFIGIEREYKGKDAGLKTNMLVSAGSCAYVILSLQFLGSEFTDVTRVLSQVVTGIGFLGAGVILKREDTIHGLTTAATVWCSAAAGCIAALYMITNLMLFTAAVVAVNIIFGLLDKKI